MNTKLNGSEPENPEAKERQFVWTGGPLRCLVRHIGRVAIRRHGARTGAGHLLAPG